MGSRTERYVSSSSLGRGNGLVRTTNSRAGSESCGITARAKNWLCAAAQTTLDWPPRNSAGGTRGMHIKPWVEKKLALTSCALEPLYHITPTAEPSSREFMGVAVP